MAMNDHALDGEVRTHPLPCGHSVEEVWEHLETGTVTSHEAACEHCASSRRSLRQLAEATRLLLADPAEPPAGLLDRVMAAVRADVRRVSTLALPSDRGPVDVSVPAVAAVLRFAADGVPGVRARSCHLEVLDPDAGTVRVAMTLSSRWGTGTAVFDEVRSRVGAALAGQVGLTATAVDLELVDVWQAGPR